ncbi:hypothetical protein [Nocardia huaxiensis]|uniref:hypothetical protein n=1 Tax=Nocardia huaxiensis TaxID=2755382 RepID=UPI001E4B06C6|nr:hypothetical protein [Nocardia huaxiensis]UFS99712.1 hypothetical protein LPY97_18440 [Nocardia huaxiensis]
MTSYKAEASASSAAATSSRQAAAQAQSISDNCTPFRKTTGTAVDRYNEFVDAHDGNTADQAAKRDTAANALDDAARTVESQLTSTGGALPADLSKKFTDYVAAARALAGAVRQMSSTSNVGPLNDASRAVNDTLNAVRDACPAK